MQNNSSINATGSTDKNSAPKRNWRCRAIERQVTRRQRLENRKARLSIIHPSGQPRDTHLSPAVVVKYRPREWQNNRPGDRERVRRAVHCYSRISAADKRRAETSGRVSPISASGTIFHRHVRRFPRWIINCRPNGNYGRSESTAVDFSRGPAIYDAIFAR